MTESPLEKKPAPGAADPEEAAADVSLRASDADRDRVADILREALAEGRLDAAEHAERIGTVYAARTVADLEPVVRDLPRRSTPDSTATRGAGEADDEPAAKENLVAIFSGAVRKGRWHVPRRIDAIACFGGIEIDLTDAVFTHQRVVINATAVFGGVEIRVPENVSLQQKGAGVFGGFDVHTMVAEDPDAPVVLVKGAAVFGGVEAKPKLGKRLRDFRDRLRKELGGK